MVLSLRRVLRRLLFAALFLLLTLVMAEALRLMSGWFMLPDPHAVPQGRAVKVFESGPDEPSALSVLDRLRLFWLAGG